MSIVEEPGSAFDPSIIRWAGYGLAATGVAVALYDRYYPSDPATVAALVFPGLTLAVLLIAPQLFEITARGRRSANPVLAAPVAGLIFLAAEYGLVDPTWPWESAAAGVVVGLGLGFFAGRRHPVTGSISLTVFTAVCVGLYVYAAMWTADVQFDHSGGQAVRVQIADKHISGGRSTTYYLDLPAWGPRTQPRSISVSSSIYNAVQPGDPICILWRPGAFGAPWFIANLCPSSGPTALDTVPPGP